MNLPDASMLDKYEYNIFFWFVAVGLFHYPCVMSCLQFELRLLDDILWTWTWALFYVGQKSLFSFNVYIAWLFLKIMHGLREKNKNDTMCIEIVGCYLLPYGQWQNINAFIHLSYIFFVNKWFIMNNQYRQYSIRKLAASWYVLFIF